MPHGIHDVTDHGARDGDFTGTVDAALEAIRGEILKARAAGDRQVKTVYFPGAARPYYLNRTHLVDYSWSEFRGDGPTRSVLSAHNPHWAPRCPILALGVFRDGPDGKPTSHDHWVDLHGLLDASAAPRRGARWGLRTKGDRDITLPFSALSHPGRGWRDIRQFTVALAVAAPPGGSVVMRDWSTPMWRAGFSGWATENRTPWAIYSSPGGVEIVFRTTDGEPPHPAEGRHQSEHRARVELVEPPPGEPLRLAVAVDLIGHRIRAWAGREEVEVRPVAGFGPESGWGASGKLQLVANELYPMKLGGHCDWALGSHGAIRDVTYCGFQVREGADHDPTAWDDESAYFRRTDRTIGLLPLTDPPGGPQGGRLVTVSEGLGDRTAGLTYGYFYDSQGTGSEGGRMVADIAVRDLGFVLAGTDRRDSTGACLAVGPTIRLAVERCHFVGGMHGVAPLKGRGNTWGHRYRDLQFLGQSDAAIYSASATAWFDALHLETIGRVGVRISGGGATVRDSFFGIESGSGPTRTEYAIRQHSDGLGASLVLDRVVFDHEHAGPSRAVVGLEGSQHGYSFAARDCEFSGGGGGAAAPPIELARPWPSLGTPRYRVEGSSYWTKAPPGGVLDRGEGTPSAWRAEGAP